MSGVICPRCQTQNAEGQRFCGECAARLLVSCRSCKSENDPSAKFCGTCGRSLVDTTGRSALLDPLRASTPKAIADRIKSGGAALDGQRRQVTVLFADLVGYTPLAERLDEEAVYQLMQSVLKPMIDAVHIQAGTVQELTGDGIMALFGAPVAVEDAPVRACRAALDIQDRMSMLNEQHAPSYGQQFQVRIGIHTGPVVVGKIGDDLRMKFTALGDTVNLASRLELSAEPGTIAISEVTHELVQGYAESEFLGTRSVKGKSEPQRIYRLKGLRAGVTRFDVSVRRGLAPFVGRSAELAVLEQCWQEARKGQVRVVNVVGEPGIGKSRLVHELRERFRPDEAVWLAGHCSADGQTTAFLPLTEILRASLAVDDGAGRLEIEQKVRDGSQALDLDQKALPYLLNLLGQQVEGKLFRKEDAELSGIRTRAVLRQFLSAQCRKAPVVMFIEDIHWLDAASEDYLNWAMELEGSIPLLLLFTYRPYWSSPWGDHANVTELVVEPLSSASTEDLLRSKLGRVLV